MMIYDYNGLLKAVKTVKKNKSLAEMEKTMNRNATLMELETELKSSGLLDDWYDLKRVCKEVGVRIMPFGDWNESKQGPLMEDCECFCDNGMFAQCMSSGSYWRDMFGFSYKDRNFKWKITHDTKDSLFTEFKNKDAEINTKIRLIQLFTDRYEEYREIQLQRVYTKLGKIVEETEKIKK